MDFAFKTPPFGAYQQEEFDQHWSDHARGLLWEMGTGKSWETLQQAGKLYAEGKIDTILIAAPDGVHRNWITDEIPKHLDDNIASKARCFAYQTDKAATKWHQAECEALISHPGLVVLAISYDGVITEPLMEKDPVTGRRKTIWRGGKRFIWDILSKRKCMYVADEARRIKNPKADRTKVIVKSSVYAPYRRLLNGTPVPNGPFDVYSQMLFLDENFWLPHGIGTYTAFKTMFGVFQKGAVRDASGKLREFDQLIGYKNLDLLQTILGTMCSRVTKDQVLNLPPKIYSRRCFELTAKQKKVYADLEADFMAVMETGDTVTAPLAITRLLRFQQVTSGFVPVDNEEEPIYDIGATNPRLDLLDQIVEDVPHGCIIWCRFNRTVDMVLERLKTAKKTAVRYDGQVTGDAREAAKFAFQKGESQFFVAKAATAGEGLTLTQARTVIYVENTFDLAMRLQSEDRAHRIGQEHPVEYIDLVALGTVDVHITESLQKKFDVAQKITGDAVKRWLLSAAA